MSGYDTTSPPPSAGLNFLLARLQKDAAMPPKPLNLEPSANYGYYSADQQQGELNPPAGYQQPSVSSPVPPPPVFNPPHHSSAILSPAETPLAQAQHPLPASGGMANHDRTSSLLSLLKFKPAASSPNQTAPISTPSLSARDTSAAFAGSESNNQITSPSHRGGGPDLLATLMGVSSSSIERPARANSQISDASQAQATTNAPSGPPPDTQNFLLSLLNQTKPPQSDSSPQLKQAKQLMTPPSKSSSQFDAGELSQNLGDMSLGLQMPDSLATEEQVGPSSSKENEAPKATQGIFTYSNPFHELSRASPLRQLDQGAAATAPAIQILKRQGEGTDNKRNVDERSAKSGLAQTKRNVDASPQISSGPPTPLPDGRSKLEALIGIGASGDKESVAEAINDVGDQVDKQVQEAIARAEQEESQATIEQDLDDMFAAKTDKEFEETAQIAAQAIKKELEKEGNGHALDNLPTPLAEAVKDIVDETAHGHIADSWESADADFSPVKEGDDEKAVEVHNFPMKPWSSITIKASKEPRPEFRSEIIMDIAKLKKDFDQIDRTLVTASNNFIVYGMSKAGGFRVIRQEDGVDARYFDETHDRVFNVAISAAPTDLKEAVIATGLSGAVYWALIKDGEGDNLEESNHGMNGFVLPPVHASENEAPGGVLKTRARKSSCHPDFFAIARGKLIQIVWPSVIIKSCLKDGKDRTVDTEKYAEQCSLKINTGKAGKDFTFSEDDTVIVSLDKAGRVRFWDVRSLTESDSLGNPLADYPIEIKNPINTFNTTHPHEKPWPTSVTLVDKLRPYQRGGALRYMIVGMNQNHQLQLWDLALGKPVQEINLPHAKESDAACNVLYQAATGMIIVGHPTRNSVYFLHLSAPKYNLPKSLSQAEYMQKLADGGETLPKPDSTAVISGMREYSFDSKGTLRSLDILQSPNSSSDSSALFELYSMHSKGVSCLSIKQWDLGWTEDNKVINAVEKSNLISIDTLKEIPTELIPEARFLPQPSAPVVQQPLPTAVAPRPEVIREAESVSEGRKKAARGGDTSAGSSKSEEKMEKKAEKKEVAPSGTVTPHAEPQKQGKGKKKKANHATAENGSPAQVAPSSKVVMMDPMSNVRNGNLSKTNLNSMAESAVAAAPTQNISEATLKKIENNFAMEFKKIADNIDSVKTSYRQQIRAEIETEREMHFNSGKANQDNLLRIVASTLSENTEATLTRVVAENVEQSVKQHLATGLNESVLPVVVDEVYRIVREQLGGELAKQVQTSVNATMPNALAKVVPDAIHRALQQPQVLKLMSDALAKGVAYRVEEQFADLMTNTVMPQFTALAVQTAQKTGAEAQRHVAEQMGMLERQRDADTSKIQELQQLVTGLTQMVSSMATSQAEFQNQFLRLQQQMATEKRESSRPTQSEASRSNAPATPVEKPQPNQRYLEVYNEVKQLVDNGDLQGAIVAWLQSGMPQELYEGFFSQYNPDFLRGLDTIVLLTIGSVVTEELKDKLMPQRMGWLEVVLQVLQHQHAQGTLDASIDYIPNVVARWQTRLELLFTAISNLNGQDPLLKQVSALNVSTKRLLDALRSPIVSPPSYRGSVQMGSGGRGSHY